MPEGWFALQQRQQSNAIKAFPIRVSCEGGVVKNMHHPRAGGVLRNTESLGGLPPPLGAQG